MDQARFAKMAKKFRRVFSEEKMTALGKSTNFFGTASGDYALSAESLFGSVHGHGES